MQKAQLEFQTVGAADYIYHTNQALSGIADNLKRNSLHSVKSFILFSKSTKSWHTIGMSINMTINKETFLTQIVWKITKEKDKPMQYNARYLGLDKCFFIFSFSLVMTIIHFVNITPNMFYFFIFF